MKIEKIMELLPHRYPFLLVDRIISMDPGKEAVAIKNVSINEIFFLGHFPDKPVMPGVLLIESMAQAAVILVASDLNYDISNKLVYLMSIENAHFRKPVVPGDTVYLHVKKDFARSSKWKISAEAKVDNVKVADACFSAILVDKTHTAS